ncbi:MAG TPA: hypothetical protein VGO93_28295, partial [Candidatus Xenobia bacterium]
MADIKLEDLHDGGTALTPDAMKGIYGGAGAGDGQIPAPVPMAAADPNAPPVVVLGPDGNLPGQGDSGPSGGGGGGGCQ